MVKLELLRAIENQGKRTSVDQYVLKDTKPWKSLGKFLELSKIV